MARWSLDRLAVFGSSIGATVAATYSAVNPTVVPPTNIPQSSYSVAPPATAGKMDSSRILVYVLIGLAVVFGIRYLRK
jgi:hypothetical protein